jgi:predicted transcriptional regulator
MKTLVVGIASYEQIKMRTIAIASGKYKPTEDEPKVWFTSIESLAQVLSTDNKLLLEIIKIQEPESITELAELAGRKVSNTSRTLKNMKKYGLVDFKKGAHKAMKPVLPYKNLKIAHNIINEHDTAQFKEKKKSQGGTR